MLTQAVHNEVRALLMLIEGGADGAMVAQQADALCRALGGTRDLRTMGPQAVPLYIATLLMMRLLGH